MPLRPLPIAEPDRVFFLEARRGDDPFPSHSFPDYLDFRNGTSAIDLAAYRIAAMGLQTSAGADRAWGYLATGNYFQMLGLRPAVGRFFTPEDDGDPGIVGTTIRINGLPCTILGVAPRGFHGTEVAFYPELWVPMSLKEG